MRDVIRTDVTLVVGQTPFLRLSAPAEVKLVPTPPFIQQRLPGNVRCGFGTNPAITMHT